MIRVYCTCASSHVYVLQTTMEWGWRRLAVRVNIILRSEHVRLKEQSGPSVKNFEGLVISSSQTATLIFIFNYCASLSSGGFINCVFICLLIYISISY